MSVSRSGTASEELERVSVSRRELALDWSDAATDNNGNFFEDSFLSVGPEPGRIWDVHYALLSWNWRYQDGTSVNASDAYADVFLDFGFQATLDELPDDMAGSIEAQDNDSIAVIGGLVHGPLSDSGNNRATVGRPFEGVERFEFHDDPLTLWGGSDLHVNLAADNRLTDADANGDNRAEVICTVNLGYTSEEMDR